MIKLHLFSGFVNAKLGITPDMELGHLYSDDGDTEGLIEAAKSVGLRKAWIQTEQSLIHFDLWAAPLEKAKRLFPLVSDLELAEDMTRLNKPECEYDGEECFETCHECPAYRNVLKSPLT